MLLVYYNYSYYYRRVYSLVNPDYGFISNHGLNYSLDYSLSPDYNNIGSL